LIHFEAIHADTRDLDAPSVSKKNGPGMLGYISDRREAEEPGGEMEVKLKQDHSTAALRPALRAIKCERVPGRARTYV